MYKYVVEGGFPIKGKIKASGNKNAALPCICACILTEEEVILDNIPEINDVHVLFNLLKDIGVEVNKIKDNKYSIKAANIKKMELRQDLTGLIRASILLVGPMLARTSLVKIYPPGGDIIGRRRLDTHFLSFTALGATLEYDTLIKVKANKLVGSEIFLDEASVTATENAIMAAVLADGETTIINAASEPHVQDLCNMLNSMGAEIKGVASNILNIKGVKRLRGTSFRIGADFMQVGSLISLAAITHGELEILNADPQHLKLIKMVYAKLGIKFEFDEKNVYVPIGQELVAKTDLGGFIARIDDGPWPSFPTDLTSIMTVTATQVKGTTLIFEKMFESRMFFVDKLIAMGANIILCDPHRAVVIGATKLKPGYMSSPDVRAGMAMLIAALCAEGTSEIQNIYQIERGYESVVENLTSLGAKIKRVLED